jgi:hypothetical protein
MQLRVTCSPFKSIPMKKAILICALLVSCLSSFSQITGPVIRANFGVDADLRANFFNGFVQAGNDDWFSSSAGTGAFVIDTTGASYIVNRYATDINFRRTPFYRDMRFPQFSVVNNMLLIDGIFIRDHHGDDSTVFASGSNKNGMSPASWSTPVSQGIPDKNDILDMFMHVRRAGPNGSDSLWLFGGVSIENTTGNRYFDFEMYQTDIYYDRPTLSFKGYGPDAGHTAWLFDASGNVTRAGDIIFTAEYSSSSLSLVEARIWVHNSSLSTTPATFSWGGDFDGATPGASYGYANILPKTAGDFYTGLQCANNTWTGPFQLVKQDNSLATNYTTRQFMEFSVNLSKLGLDPYVISSDPCLMPFRRILVKSRSSTSFTAELKDFVGPFSFFRAPMADASADIPLFCGTTGISNISVSNALSTSLYTWSTTDGNIVSDSVGPGISVDQPGTYIVRQHLMDSCGSSYAMDTVTVILDTSCSLLRSFINGFSGKKRDGRIDLLWQVLNPAASRYFEIERNTGPGGQFITVGKITANDGNTQFTYNFVDDPAATQLPRIIFYRIKITDVNGNISYSKIIGINLNEMMQAKVVMLSNPVTATLRLAITARSNSFAVISVYDQSGRQLNILKAPVQKGVNILQVDELPDMRNGIYFLKVKIDDLLITQKMLMMKNQ